jgi:Fur family ferric uptake transcriptional regulator
MVLKERKEGQAMGKSSDRSTEGRLREMLREAGYRATAQRLLVLRLLQNTKGHAGADDLYTSAHARDPNLSLSTVYRTLNSLKEAGLVRELHLDQEHHHYELVDGAAHYHLVCQTCGKVIEVECSLVDDMLSRIQDRYEFQVTGSEMELVGYCADCRTTLPPTDE